MSTLPARLLALTLFGLAACTGGEDTPDAGPTGPDPRYWGLADDVCLHYYSADRTNQYTIDIDFDETTVTGVKTWQMKHALNGIEERIEWIEVLDASLVLHRRSKRGATFNEPATLYRYEPMPTYLQKDLQPGSEARSTTKASASGGGRTTTEVIDQVFSVAPLAAETFDVKGAPLESMKFTMSVESPLPLPGKVEIDRLWFAPEVGIVRFDPSGPAVGEMTLHSVEKLTGGVYCIPLDE